LAKRYGWTGDYSEVCEFVRTVHRFYGKELSIEDLEPYDEP
jgi:hypothetical protein